MTRVCVFSTHTQFVPTHFFHAVDGFFLQRYGCRSKKIGKSIFRSIVSLSHLPA